MLSDAATGQVHHVRNVADSVQRAVIPLHPARSRSSASLQLAGPTLAPFSARYSAQAAFHVQFEPMREPRSEPFGLVRNGWEIATIGIGITAGSVANALTGDVIGYGPSAVGGGVVFYVWGLWRWRTEHGGR
jgi:hypothetical protein